jgi:hypothetical protein
MRNYGAYSPLAKNIIMEGMVASALMLAVALGNRQNEKTKEEEL